ncbi:uncharacterized protein F4807DRAFT_431150 [Annulohypoxylon truncatum]|uniref:uncharacterized protein n=1 Tax=Annulohypoxylon truncatum TaxID=327061 RepID=UPI00200771FB|nr:uncharacterized protein F4807DRAFT_431150 [Annulohypoxylon truncatum]KAI1208393.1 hypothetical protein F4807DRAFT_431150 [Annulohypoxylon truncatum]
MGKSSTATSSTRANLGWDEERSDFRHSQPENMKAMGADREWWLRYVNHNLLRRKIDLRRLIIAVIVFLGLSMVIFEVTHHELYRLAPFQNPPLAPEPDVPGQCTTWPVDWKGRYTPSHEPGNNTVRLESFAPKGGWKKPVGIKIVALVFFGRKRTVDFLDCYLQQNLAANGGYVDEIRFMVHTNNDEDLDYLKDLVSRREEHYHIVEANTCEGSSYGCIWDSVVEDDTIYVKIDDDIIFIHPDAIPQLVHTRIATPHPFAVSANLVNSPLTGYEHFHVGAIHAFRPDPSEKPSHAAAESWRPSEKSHFPESSLPQLNISDLRSIEFNDEIFPARPYYGHPFLLISDDPFDLMKSPMGLNYLHGGDKGVESMYEKAWKSWAIASQQQYSLLKNLEDNAIAHYFFGSPQEFPSGKNTSAVALKHQAENRGGPGAEQLYNTQYKRYNLNFVALWGHDIKAALPIAEDDEEDITVTIPKRTHRPFVIDTRSVVGHLSFYPQHDGVRETDLLDRWRAFANEMVCTPQNQKSPFDKRCPGF